VSSSARSAVRSRRAAMTIQTTEAIHREMPDKKRQRVTRAGPGAAVALDRAVTQERVAARARRAAAVLRERAMAGVTRSPRSVRMPTPAALVAATVSKLRSNSAMTGTPPAGMVARRSARSKRATRAAERSVRRRARATPAAAVRRARFRIVIAPDSRGMRGSSQLNAAPSCNVSGAAVAIERTRVAATAAMWRPRLVSGLFRLRRRRRMARANQ
jgi:hypothetical protein